MPSIKPHILLVDDERDIRFSMKLVLENADYKVTELSNGAVALEVARVKEDTDDPISLIVTDLMMPVMDGKKMIEGVRELERKIPVLVVTGFGHKAVMEELRPMGVDEILDKPFKIEDLLEKISNILSEEKNRTA